MLGFLQAAQDGNYKAAADYLQMSAARRQSQGPDLAEKLKVSWTAPSWAACDGSARVPKALRISASRISKPSEFFPTRCGCSRCSRPGRRSEFGKIWLFSADTLSKVPELYDSVEAHQVENKLPQSLVRNLFLGMPLWQWLALFAAIPVAHRDRLDGGSAAGDPTPPLAQIQKSSQSCTLISRMSTPLLISFSALAHRIIDRYLGLPLLHTSLLSPDSSPVFISIGFFWFLLRVTSLTMQRLRIHAISSGRIGTGTLMVLG